MTLVDSFVLLDQRTEVDHSFISIDLQPVLKLMVPGTEHGRLIVILNNNTVAVQIKTMFIIVILNNQQH